MTTRDCPICGGTSKEKIYQQHFSKFSKGGLLNGYDVVICRQCGFGFADRIPEQPAFDEYYKQMSKYENEYLDGQVSTSAMSTYRAIVEAIAPLLPDKQARILDVGCATGALLAEFKRSGYGNVVGVDPSPSCARTARRLYDIQVLNCAISEVRRFEAPFDFLILNSVLEHIRDVNASLETLRTLLKADGMMWIEVPDSPRFANYVSAPFQQFSMEHINYFSSVSLTNLLQKSGFKLVTVWKNERNLEAILDPALSTVFRRSEKTSTRFMSDEETKLALLDYIERSYQADGSVAQKIESLVSSGRSFIIWGAGTHTQRLLAHDRLARANIRAFIDSNPRYQGKHLNGIAILAPDRLKDMHEPILISSRLYQEEIVAQIHNELHLKNEIITLY